MIALPTALLLTLAVGALSRLLYLCYFHPLAQYPGPWLARFTNLWRLSSFLSGTQHLTELSLHRRYGRVVRVGPNWLSFASLADFAAIYGFHRCIEKDSFYDFGRSKPTYSLFTAKTEAQHRDRRKKVVTPAFTVAKVQGGYAEVVRKNVGVLMARLDAMALNGRKEKANVARVLHRFTIDTSLEIIYGPEVCPQPLTDMPATEGFPEAIKKAGKSAWTASLLPLPGWLMTWKPIMALTGRLDSNKSTTPVNLAAVAATSARLIFNPQLQEIFSQPQQSSILKHWVDLPSDDSRKMSPSELWGEAFNLVLAGTGSSAAALTALLYRLGRGAGKPWQTRIRAEIAAQQNVLDSGVLLPLSSTFPVLFAVIKETLRVDAPFPTAFPRTIRAGAESALPGLPTLLPPGTMVSASTFVLGRSRSVWGADADEWKPQRWLDGEDLDERFVAFSKGARQCIGRDLAMLMIAHAAIAVIQKWELSSVGELHGDSSFLEMSYEACWLQFELMNNE